MAIQQKLIVLTPDVTSKEHHVGVCSGHCGFVGEASDPTGQSADPQGSRMLITASLLGSSGFPGVWLGGWTHVMQIERPSS